MTARAVCPNCGREMAVAPPSGGDGSVDVFPRHPPTGRRRCAGSRQDVQAVDYALDSNRTV